MDFDMGMHIPSEFFTDPLLRSLVMEKEAGGGHRQQATLLKMVEHRHLHGVPTRDGGRKQRGVSAIRVQMLREQIVAIMLSPGVLSFTKALGERLTSGPVITSGTIQEFRQVFVYGLKRCSDVALSIVTITCGICCCCNS